MLTLLVILSVFFGSIFMLKLLWFFAAGYIIVQLVKLALLVAACVIAWRSRHAVVRVIRRACEWVTARRAAQAGRA